MSDESSSVKTKSVEAAIRGRRAVNLGGVIIEVVDPRNVLPVFADVIVEARSYAGVVQLSLANTVKDGDAAAEAVVTTRVRLSLSTTLDLRNMLTLILEAEMPGKEKAN